MVKAIVLTCMDYRFVGSVAKSLNQMGYVKDYDLFVVAGGSLTYSDDSGNTELLNCFSAWQKSFEDHVDLAVSLHQISEIVVVDHEDCGAYNAFYGKCTESQLTLHHQHNLSTFAKKLQTKYPQLKIITMMAGLDASIKII